MARSSTTTMPALIGRILRMGAVRGFAGRGSSRRDAYHDCIRRVDVELRPFGRTSDVDAIVRDITAPASGERARIEADWHPQP